MVGLSYCQDFPSWIQGFSATDEEIGSLSKLDVNLLESSNFISLAQASDLASLSQDHLRRLAEQGKLGARKIGRNWVTTEEAVLEYMRTRKPPGRPKKLD